MIILLRKIWFKIFPIGREKAIKIAATSSVSDISQYQAFKKYPHKLNIYNPPKEPCWYITAPWGDGLNGQALRSSRIIIISKKTGLILYDGPANDEG